jgi:capsular exopolysaccharide synthesis family protein
MRTVQDNVILARSDLAERSARHRQVQSLIEAQQAPDSIGNALNSEVVRDLRRQEAELTAAQAERERTLGERHPDVLNGRQQVADIRSQIDREMARIAANAQGEVEVARARLGTLQSTLGAAGAQMANTNAASVRLSQLIREAAAAQTVYEAFLQRYHEMVGQGATAPLQVRLVSAGLPSEQPSWPDWRWALLIALAAGTLVSAFTLLFVEISADTVVTASDVERRVGLPVLASVPIVPRRVLRLLPPEARHPAGYLAQKQYSSYAEAFRVLRTSLWFSASKRSMSVVAITSSKPNEGKTTCALSLARAAALSGQKVLLIDCDFRHSSINSLLEIEPERGLWHVLSGESDWRAVTGQDEASPAHILPSAQADPTAVNLLSGEAMEVLMTELRRHYDLIILDCPPVWAVAESRQLAALSDGVVLVSRWNRTPIRGLASTMRHLAPSGAHIVGVVVNAVDPNVIRRAGYVDSGFGGYADAHYYSN